MASEVYALTQKWLQYMLKLEIIWRQNSSVNLTNFCTLCHKSVKVRIQRGWQESNSFVAVLQLAVCSPAELSSSFFLHLLNTSQSISSHLPSPSPHALLHSFMYSLTITDIFFYTVLLPGNSQSFLLTCIFFNVPFRSHSESWILLQSLP